MAKLPSIKCPCCWQPFEITETLWIAESDELKDDPYLPNKHRRFLPERFTPDCYAIDDKDEKCQRRFACPHCHLEIPEDYLKSKPFTVSIVGTQSAGKTHFLVALYEWQQEKLSKFGLSCQSVTNSEQLKINCETLFPKLSRFNRDKPVALPPTLPVEGVVTIPETEKGLKKGGYEFALPFMYSMVSQQQEKNYMLCLYDHAGENFEDKNVKNLRKPLAQHIGFSDALFFLFDPTQIPSFIDEYKYHNPKESTNGTVKLHGSEKKTTEHMNPNTEQCKIFDVMTHVIKNTENSDKLFDNGKYNRPLIIVVSKCDAWIHCLPNSQNTIQSNPFGHPEIFPQVSADVENFIETYYPKFSQAVRNFASDYIYIPVSATGCDPTTYYEDTTNENGNPDKVEKEGFIPGTLKPIWIGVPFLYALQKHEDQLIKLD